ncbi:MAG: DinB family protein [Thermoflavifilum sp.]|nr:DinB family protein [Thermoflavifilum sp.]
MNHKTLLLQDLEREFTLTDIALQRVPEAHFSWKPHDKSMSLAQLAGHVATLSRIMLVVLQEPELNFEGNPPRRPPLPENHAALMESFYQMREQVWEAIQTTTEEHLFQHWVMRNGDQIIFEGPRIQLIRWMGLHHLVHHRAELIVYLRLLDVAIPGLYGPSADEPPAWMKK